MKNWYRRRIFSRLLPLLVLIIIVVLVISHYYGTVRLEYYSSVTFLFHERPDVFAVISFLAVIFTGWGVYRGEIRHSRNRSFQTLEIAIAEFQGAIQIDTVYFSYIKGRNEIKFRNVFFDTTVYETIVHSGLFTYFPRELQIPITKLYSGIRNHNEYLKYRIELGNSFALYGSTARNVVAHDVFQQLEAFLTRLDADMESLITRIRLYERKKWWEKLISFFYR